MFRLTADKRHIYTMGLGSFLLAIGALSVGWLPPLFNVSVNGILEAARLSDYGPIIGRVSAVIGGAIILHTWLRLGVDVLRKQITSMRALWSMLLVSIVPLLLVPPLFSRDLYSYIAQGRLMAHNINPYTHGVSALPGWFQLGADPIWAETPTPYGPIYLAFQGFVAQVLPNSPWWAMLALKATAILGLILIALAVTILAQQHGIAPEAAFWLAALNPLMLLHLVAGGHNDSLMIAGMLWAFVFANQRRFVLAGLAMIFAAGVKPIALLALPFVALAWLPRKTSWRSIVTSWLSATVLVGSGLLALGALLNLGVGWIGALSTPGSVKTLLSPSTALGQLIGLVASSFNFDITETLISSFRLFGLASALVLVALIALRPQGQSPVRQASFAFTAVIALSPVMQPWYLLWALPLVAVSGLARAWHLRTIVFGTAFFVVYALAEINVVTDSVIDITDVISVVAAALVVLAVSLASPRERLLVTGEQYASGLKPENLAAAQAQRMDVTQVSVAG